MYRLAWARASDGVVNQTLSLRTGRRPGCRWSYGGEVATTRGLGDSRSLRVHDGAGRGYSVALSTHRNVVSCVALYNTDS